MRAPLVAYLQVAAFEVVNAAEDRLNQRLVPIPADAPVAHPAWTRWPEHVSPPRKLDTAFVINTYQRPHSCARLIEQLADAIAETPGVGDYAVVVLDDSSALDYGEVRERAHSRFGDRLEVLRSPRNYGKHRFWRTVQRSFDWVRERRPEVTVLLQDDIELPRGGLRDALEIWSEIPDPQKAVLNLLVTDDDEPGGRFVKLQRVRRPGQRYCLTGWFDLAAYLVGPRFWEITRHEVFSVHPSRWVVRPAISTGVTRQLVRRLWRRASVYQVASTIAFHGSEPSQMNTEARRERPMDNRPR